MKYPKNDDFLLLVKKYSEVPFTWEYKRLLSIIILKKRIPINIHD